MKRFSDAAKPLLTATLATSFVGPESSNSTFARCWRALGFDDLERVDYLLCGIDSEKKIERLFGSSGYFCKLGPNLCARLARFKRISTVIRNAIPLVAPCRGTIFTSGRLEASRRPADLSGEPKRFTQNQPLRRQR